MLLGYDGVVGDDGVIGVQFGDAGAGVQFGGCVHLEGVLLGDGVGGVQFCCNMPHVVNGVGDDDDGSSLSSNDSQNDSISDSSDIIVCICTYVRGQTQRLLKLMYAYVLTW